MNLLYSKPGSRGKRNVGLVQQVLVEPIATDADGIFFSISIDS